MGPAEGSRLKRPVVLVGMMGSGKSAVGRAVAKRVGAPFVDCDREIEIAEGSSIADLFARRGEDYFRESEARALERILSGPAAIVAAGGGTFMNEENRRMIDSMGVSLWLEVDLELLWSRVRHKSTRPLLSTPNPKETLEALLAAREPVYRKAALSIRAEPGYAVSKTATLVVAKLADASARLGIFSEES